MKILKLITTTLAKITHTHTTIFILVIFIFLFIFIWQNSINVVVWLQFGYKQAREKGRYFKYRKWPNITRPANELTTNIHKNVCQSLVCICLSVCLFVCIYKYIHYLYANLRSWRSSARKMCNQMCPLNRNGK